MKVILKEDLTNLGLAGELVNVKAGYGRNFLIPRGLAVVANKSNTLRYAEETRQRAHKLEQKRKDAAALADRLSTLELVIKMPVGEENRLFGTVTTQQVADVLAAKGFDVDRRKISLDEEIRLTGVYPAKVKLHPEHTAEIKITVEPDMARAPVATRVAEEETTAQEEPAEQEEATAQEESVEQEETTEQDESAEQEEAAAPEETTTLDEPTA